MDTADIVVSENKPRLVWLAILLTKTSRRKVEFWLMSIISSSSSRATSLNTVEFSVVSHLNQILNPVCPKLVV